MKFVYTLIIVCCAFFAQAQHTFDWSKYNSLPFVEDKQFPVSFCSFEKDVLSPIKESKADMEIRFYSYQHLGSRTILTMQCFGDSLVCKTLNRSISGNWPLPVSKEDSVLYENGGNYYNWHIEELTVNKKIDNIMDELIRTRLFILSNTDVDSIKDALRRKYACGNTVVRYSFSEGSHAYFSIKINNRYRTFITRYIMYDDEKINRESFLFGRESLKAFKTVFDERMITKAYDIECRSAGY